LVALDSIYRKDLKGLALARLREAKVLLANGEYSGAYYLAGYAVECALKACIAKQTKHHEFPDKKRAVKSWDHNLEALVGVAELQASLQAESKSNPKFSANWDVVKDWSETSRYKTWNQQDAQDLIQAISENKHGVLPWLKHHWWSGTSVRARNYSRLSTDQSQTVHLSESKQRSGFIVQSQRDGV
jgi:HEPN domain-containing protein